MYSKFCCNDRSAPAGSRSCFHKMYHGRPAVEPAPPTLADVVPGQHAVVSSLLAGGSMRRRLLDIGLTPGTQVICLGKSPLDDPAAFLIRCAVIALRRKDCRDILIADGGQRNPEEANRADGTPYTIQDHVPEEVSWD